MTKATAISADDKKWRAEEDVRTLIRAKEIKGDKPRFRIALKLAKEQLEELKTISEDS